MVFHVREKKEAKSFVDFIDVALSPIFHVCVAVNVIL